MMLVILILDVMMRFINDTGCQVVHGDHDVGARKRDPVLRKYVRVVSGSVPGKCHSGDSGGGVHGFMS